MPNVDRSSPRPRRMLGLAAGLLGGLLSLPVDAATARDLIAGWAARLDQRATELEKAPRVKATLVGAGMVLKKGDGGMVDAVVPGPVQPAADAPPTAVALRDPADAALWALAGIEPPPVDLSVPTLTLPVRARSADRVGRLATRLIELGHLASDRWTDSFDDELEAAVRSFQTAEGLMPDGKVGEATRQALDRTPAQAAALMRNAVVSLKSFQASVPDRVILVNLPSQTVTYIDRGALVFTMRAVVGRPSRQTPLIQDKVTSVTINPTWTVPPTVLTEDKLPNLRKKGNSGIKNAVVYLDGKEVVPERVNWWSVTPDRIRIVQQPGDDNALGRFRFNLTNGDGIFLHGTNDPRLFDRDMRAASSGCVRLADARGVAETLLRAASVDKTAIDAQLDSGKTRTIALPAAVPVRFVYWTATVEPQGTVRVHPGIYEDAAGVTETAPVKRVPPKPTSRPVPAGTSRQAKGIDTTQATTRTRT